MLTASTRPRGPRRRYVIGGKQYVGTFTPRHPAPTRHPSSFRGHPTPSSTASPARTAPAPSTASTSRSRPLAGARHHDPQRVQRAGPRRVRLRDPRGTDRPGHRPGGDPPTNLLQRQPRDRQHREADGLVDRDVRRGHLRRQRQLQLGHLHRRTARPPRTATASSATPSASTGAESMDIKEGTTGGLIQDNTFDGAGMSGSWADSWIDMKGNAWTITDNHGTTALEDGFQVHGALTGWGLNNVFKDNTADVQGPGYGFWLQNNVTGNVIACTNTVLNAAAGYANVACGPSRVLLGSVPGPGVDHQDRQHSPTPAPGRSGLAPPPRRPDRKTMRDRSGTGRTRRSGPRRPGQPTATPGTPCAPATIDM